MSLSVTNNFDHLLKYLRQAPPESIDNADKAMHRGALTIQRDAKIEAPKFQSILTNSIQVLRKGVMHYVVGTNQQHAAPQEFGTKPGYWPNMREGSDFVKWVRGIGGNDDSVFLIARSISRNGTQAQPFMRPAFERNIDSIINNIGRAVGKGLA